MPTLRRVDESNRAVHRYLMPDDECYFLHEYTARAGYAHSAVNQFIHNLKKSPTKRLEPQYQHKLQAIERAIAEFKAVFASSSNLYAECTFVPMPPSQAPGAAEYDDRMWQVVQGICKEANADARELISQTNSYDPAHLANTYNRIKPKELQALYRLDTNPPKPTVLLFDDVLTTGTHFRAAKSAIVTNYHEVRVVGLFIARRVFPDQTES